MNEDEKMIQGIKSKARIVLLVWIVVIATVMGYGVYWVFYDSRSL